MIADEFPDLEKPDHDPNAPCKDKGWPTFAFLAETTGYEAALHRGPTSVKWVRSGSETYDVDGVAIDVTPQRLLILGDGQDYASRSNQQTASFCAFFHKGDVADLAAFHQNHLQRLLDEVHVDPVGGLSIAPQTLDDSTAVARSMEQLYAVVTRETSRLAIQQAMSGLLTQVLFVHDASLRRSDALSVQKSTTRREVYRRLMLASTYMTDKCTEDLSLGDVAEAACMSRYHFLRSFRDVMGVTPFRFICAQRVEKAKDLLRHSSDPVVVVAERVGFESHTSFHAAFRRHTGETPQQYRQRVFRNLEERRRLPS
jgi:AraC family transcriptional regulator